MQAVMHGYVAWALQFPRRFKLVYGSWSKGSAELADDLLGYLRAAA
jgi:hypothetical protein